MPKNSVTRFLNSYFVDVTATEAFSKDGYQNLRTYLGRVEMGQPKLFTAPFAKGQSMSKVMQDWDDVLSAISTRWPTLYAFEKDLAKKVGPMSIMMPFRDRLGDVAHYYEDILLSSAPIQDSAISAVLEEYSGLRGLRVRSQKRVDDLMKHSTNSGAPFFTKRRNVRQETVPANVFTGLGRHPEVWQQLPGDQYYRSAPAVVGWRGQEGGPTEEDVKQRVVWMFPYGVNVAELQVYQPLIEGAQALRLVPAWVSMDQVDRKVTDLFDSKDRDDLIVCTDFSRFDQHFNPDMQRAAEAILKQLLTADGASKNWLVDVFPAKYYISLVIPWSANPPDVITTLQGRHGMASGSGGTNVDETLVHRALQYEAAMLRGKKLNPNSQCLGDDGILSYPGITVEDVVEAYQSHGQECNLDKQYASSQDCVYLRRWHHTDYREDGVCVGVYSTFRALGRLRYLERYMDPEYWSPELVALRQLSIIENCNHHPLKEQFAQFCMKRDKYRLGLDLPGFFDRLTELAIEATGHMQDFLGYTKTLQGEGPEGIADWWIVKYLKSFR